MIISLWRFAKKESYCVGRIFADGKYVCDSLERPVLCDGTLPYSAVNQGIYELSTKYSEKFKRCVVELKNVYGRTDILFHAGNTVNDSSGCILTGKNTAQGMLTQSKEYENKLFEIVSKVIKSGDKVILDIRG
ncbi:MAG: DUF5675 family protein [Endomicrobium sp.]|jgi:hypothetical protein|nr:DUF5675 family protein [Endomicrobium sp.]